MGVEMAEEPNLRAKVSVAMRAGDSGGWTGLGFELLCVFSGESDLLMDAVCFKGQNSRAHK